MNLRKSTPDVIADQLRAEILTGAIASGSQLKQDEVAARFGASIVPVREAFQRLAGDGLVQLQANKGVRVTATSAEDFVDIADLRRMLEPRALQLSAPRLDSGDLDRALGALARASASTDPLERAELHWEFHRVLYSKCGRPRLLAHISTLHLGISRYLLPIWSMHGLSEHWDESHEQIVEAIRRADVQTAMNIVTEQIEESSSRVLSALQPGYPPPQPKGMPHA